jgi:hypothetical protein
MDGGVESGGRMSRLPSAVVAAAIRRPADLVGCRVLCPHCNRVLQVVAAVDRGPFWLAQFEDGEWARYWPDAIDE